MLATVVAEAGEEFAHAVQERELKFAGIATVLERELGSTIGWRVANGAKVAGEKFVTHAVVKAGKFAVFVRALEGSLSVVQNVQALEGS